LKLAYSVATPDVSNPRAFGYRDDFSKAIDLLAKLGFDGVELIMVDPSQLDTQCIYEVLRASGLEVPMIGTGELFGQDGLGLVLPDANMRHEAMDRLKSMVRFAAPLGAQINLGRSRGQYVEGVSREQTDEWAEKAFGELSDYAGDYGVVVALEPIARYACSFINSTQEGMEWVSRVNRHNFRLMLDAYHMNIEDRTCIPDSIRQAASVITHVHLSDTNRKPPGWGHMDFATIMLTLDEVGYSNYVSAEQLNYPTQDDAIQRFFDVISPLVSR
jgi:sugar phosphate isomerase/epimerase